MSFLVLLLAVCIEKFSALRQRVQRDGPWLNELAKLESGPRTAARPWFTLALLVLVPVLLLQLVLTIVGSVAYGWLVLPIHLLVLIYSLGRIDLIAVLGRFAMPVGAAMCRRRCMWPSATWLLQGVQSYMLWQAFQSFFAVIFWYFVLGPVAALAYRLLALAAEHGKTPALVERTGMRSTGCRPDCWPQASRWSAISWRSVG